MSQIQPVAIVSTPRPEGYMMSSMDLHAGLETTALAIGTLPVEVLRELLRLRESWSPTNSGFQKLGLAA